MRVGRGGGQAFCGLARLERWDLAAHGPLASVLKQGRKKKITVKKWKGQQAMPRMHRQEATHRVLSFCLPSFLFPRAHLNNRWEQTQELIFLKSEPHRVTPYYPNKQKYSFYLLKKFERHKRLKLVPIVTITLNQKLKKSKFEMNCTLWISCILFILRCLHYFIYVFLWCSVKRFILDINAPVWIVSLHTSVF